MTFNILSERSESKDLCPLHNKKSFDSGLRPTLRMFL